MRKNRVPYAALSEEEKQQSRCRAYTNVLIKRGTLKRGPCATCGTTKNVEAHHPDYSKPREVIWKCRRCHRVDRFAI